MIWVLTHYTTDWNKIAEITLPVLKEYSERHGYKLSAMEILPINKYNGIPKLSMVLSLLEDGDIALVLDADTMITNMNIKIEDFTQTGKEFYFSEGMNCGVFIVKKTKFSEYIIQAAIDSIASGVYHCEQDAFETIIGPTRNDHHVEIVKHPCFNSYLSELYPEVPQPVTEQQGQWKIGSYILHLPALSIDKRVGILKSTPVKR
jgi:hypothetical protein